MAGFVAVHVVLLLGTFDAIDLEEMEYGNVAVAMLDGHVEAAGYDRLTTDPSSGDRLMDGAGRRRRTVWSIEPLAFPFFAILGPSMWSLKLAAIFASGLWAALWFLVALRLAPGASRWIPALLLALPLPLVQRSVLSATSITAHLGSSAWHAAALLPLLAIRGRGTSAALLLLLSGLASGLGLHCSFSLAPLLAGIAWLAWRRTGWRALPAWATGLIPGLVLAWAFRDPSRSGAGLITGLTGLSEGSAFRETGLGGVLRNAAWTFVYGPGLGRVDPQTLDLHYLPASGACSALFLGVAAAGWRAGRARGQQADRARSGHPDLAASLAISAGAFVAAFLASGFRLETGFFDGLRYLLPVCSMPALLATWALARMRGRRPRWAAAGLLVASQAAGFVLLFRPAVFPAPWWMIQGYESPVMKAWMAAPLEPERIAEERLGRWALWAGISDARRAGGPGSWEDLVGRAARHGLPASSQDEYWRGVGIGLLLRVSGQEQATIDLATAPADLRPPVLEGAAMGTAWAGCSEALRDDLLRAAPADGDALWYGFGRADVYCRVFRDSPERIGLRESWTRGYLDGFRRDWWSGRGEWDEAFVRRLRPY